MTQNKRINSWQSLYRFVLAISIFVIIVSLLGTMSDSRNFYVFLTGTGLFILALSDIKKKTAPKRIAYFCFIAAFIWAVFLIGGFAGALLALFALILAVTAIHTIVNSNIKKQVFTL